MKEFYLETSDLVHLSVKIFEPEKSNNRLLLINSATGVKQQIYFSFAKYFTQHGYTVITYDYRGIGESKPPVMKGFKATMRIWGTIDFKTITRFIEINYKDYQKYCLGHSVGALILGMNEDSLLFNKFIFVATQDAFLGNLNFKVAVTAMAGFGLAVPISNWFLGYFPAHHFGLGESLPKGVASDWKTLILNKKSTGRLYEKVEFDYSAKLKQETLIISAEDDPWVTLKGMNSLMTNIYPNLKRTFREIKLAESPKREIGHINFFRSFNKDLWKIVLKEVD